MQDPTQTQQIAMLLGLAGSAHHYYEQTVLQGVYDQEWSERYARCALEHGLNNLLGRSLSVEECRDFLMQNDQMFQVSQSVQSWASYTAEQLVQQYGNP